MTDTATRDEADVVTRALDIFSDTGSIHYAINDDLPVFLRRGGHGSGMAEGYVLVRLRVDDCETDVVELDCTPSVSDLDTLNRAIEVMTTVRDTLVRQGATS